MLKSQGGARGNGCICPYVFDVTLIVRAASRVSRCQRCAMFL